jgi:hypothetical protein
VSWPKVLWPAVSAALAWAARRCERCAELSANGNRRALASSHRLLALTLEAVLGGRPPEATWRHHLETLAHSYQNAGDLAGAGNCTAALAAIEMAARRPDRARELIGQARTCYAEGRTDHEPIPSGAALLERLSALLNRLEGAARVADVT